MQERTQWPLAASLALMGLAVAACADSDVSNDERTEKRPPNVIVFYADDLGYGDVGAYGAEAIPTPNIDRLAMEGLLFTDAHAAAATCTPSRYSLLTGEFGFRAEAAILPGDAPALISPGQPTVASVLKGQGYATAVVGKWHLGLGSGDVDWNQTVRPGPNEIGFDRSFLLPATGDRVPTVYLADGQVVGLEAADPLAVSYSEPIGSRPTGTGNPELLRYQADPQHSDSIINGVSRIGHMAGGEAAEWVDEDFPDVFTQEAIDFIREQKDGPFFLFFPFHDPHVPRLPHPRFQGATALGPRGDAVVQLDWMTGRILDEIDRLGLKEDTLVIFSSDNGPVLNDGYEDGAVQRNGDHKAAGPLRGGKYSAFEAGSRVPFIVSWPGTVERGVSDALVGQIDLLATLAALTDSDVSAAGGQDSSDESAAWFGVEQEGRDFLFRQSTAGDVVRHGKWKLITPTPGFSQAEHFAQRKGIEAGGSQQVQLYDLSADIGERVNVAAEYPEQVARMLAYHEAVRGVQSQ